MRLVYFSPVPWDSFSQRPHEFVRYFHNSTGGEVLWIDPYPSRFPRFSDLHFNHQGRDKLTVETERPAWISVIKMRALPIEPLPFSFLVNGLFWSDMYASVDHFVGRESILVIGKPSVSALRELQKGRYVLSIYDAMDDFPVFYEGLSRWAMASRERQILNKVSRTLVSSTELYNKLSGGEKDVRKVFNGCASDRLCGVAGGNLRKKKVESLVLGYVGTIGKWFDWKLIRRIADSIPTAVVRIVGPIYSAPPFILPSNVKCEPAVPHREALKLMAQFDIGLIPFKLNRLTASVDPIKYYEYRALNLPIISTRFGEMSNRNAGDGVYLVQESSDFLVVLCNVLEQFPFNLKMNAYEFRNRNSWEARFAKADVFRL